MLTAALAIGGGLLLMMLGVPIGAALSMASLGGILFLTGNFEATLRIGTITAFSVCTTHGFVVIPMFILMGSLAESTGIAKELFDAAYKWFSRFPGGIAITTNLACGAFAGITGSSMAMTLAMTKIALPEMKRYGYSDRLSTGVIASAGTFALMIPPSIILVVYAIFADQSVGKLLIAGFIPGWTTVVFFILLIIARTLLNPALAPTPALAYSWREKIGSTWKVGPFVFIFLGILGGILLGVWTPTEAGAGGAILVLLVGLVRRKVKGNALRKSVVDAVISSAAVFLIIIGSLLMGKLLALSGAANSLGRLVDPATTPPFLVFVALLVFYTILGCFLEGISMLALTVPLIIVMLPGLGWDPIWFGILATKLIEVAQITPPVGLNLYAVKASAPEMSLATIIRGIIPFLLCEYLVLFILYFFPQLALWLPSMMVV